MNKSTPLNQLPTLGHHGQFVNEQQKQMVMQAQSAVGSLPIPQNTQISNDATNDDDATIQEVLNQINGGNGGAVDEEMMSQHQQMLQEQAYHAHQAQLAQQAQQAQHAMQQQAMRQQQQLMMQSAPQSAPQPTFDPYQAGQFPPQPQPLAEGSSQAQSQFEQHDGSIFSFITGIAEDVKFAAFIFILFIVVHFIPIDKFLMRYFALDKIPYYDIVLKALVAFVVVVLLRKVIAK